MYYEYYTDVRATSVEQARHDGFFFLRFPLRASRLPSRRISLGSLVTLPPYILISPHLPFRPSSSIPRLVHPRLTSLSSSLFLSCHIFFILRPRASGRFNVRDFFSPSLRSCPRLLPGFTFPSLRSCTPARFAMFARTNVSPVCTTKIHEIFALSSLSWRFSLISKIETRDFFAAIFFYLIFYRSNGRNNLNNSQNLVLRDPIEIKRDSFQILGTFG